MPQSARRRVSRREADQRFPVSGASHSSGYNNPMAKNYLIGCALLLGLLSGAGAQEVAAPAETTAPAPVDTSTTALVQRLDEVNRRLIEINDYLRKPAPELAGIAVALPSKTQEAERVLGGARATDPNSADLVELSAVLQKLSNLNRIFGKWRTRLQDEIALLDPWRAQLRSDAGFLREAADPAPPAASGDSQNAPPDDVPDALRGRLLTMADSIETTREPLRKRLDVVVAADVRVGELQNALRELQVQLNATRLGRHKQPLGITAPPLWKLPDNLRQPLEQHDRTLDVG